MGYLSRVAQFLRGDTAAPASVLHSGAIESVPPAVTLAGATPAADANRALAEKDYALAVNRFKALIDLRHDDADAYCGLGIAYLKLRQDEDAADNFLMAAHFRPDFAEPHYHLALLAHRSGDFPLAIGHATRALHVREDYADAHNLFGACALALGDAERAAAAFARAVEIDHGNARFHSNLGYVLARDLGKYEQGAFHLERALEIDRDDPAIWCNYCCVLSQQGRLDEIIAICGRLLAANPEMHEARLNRALAMLKQGRFGEAWVDYEARKRTRSNYLPRPFSFAEWRGETLAGKTVLVYGEQGLGDEIMFASCLPDLMARAGRAVIECSPRLVALFQRSFPQALVHGGEQSDTDTRWLQEAGEIHWQAAAGSLPGFFRLQQQDFPQHKGYLHAAAPRVDYWRQRLDALGAGAKVGIAWRGGMVSTRRAERSLELSALAPLLRMQGVRFVSLQHDATVDEIAAARALDKIKLEHSPDALIDLDETAALISALDLVITVCSATVHLTGALGRQAWVMVPAAAEWRYLESGETMPWYPGVHMFRQPQSGDWQSVIELIARELAARFTP